MADRQLNPGDQHYGVLVDPNRQPPSVEEEAAAGWSHDYSNDFSNNTTGNGSLRDMEKSATNRDKDVNNDSSNRGRRDLGKSERSAGFDSSAFDKDMSSKNIDKSKQRKLGGFKKTVLISGITVLSGAGMGIGISGILSGPAQLIQAANVIKDFQLGIVNAQKSVRAMRNMVDLKTGLKDGLKSGVGDYFKRSRLGTTGNFLADRLEKRLAKNGVTIKNNALGMSEGISIDVSNKTPEEIKSLQKQLGLDEDKMKIGDVDGKKTMHLSKNMSAKEYRRAISVLDDPVKVKPLAFMQTRLALKRIGYVSWLHPFQKGKNWAKTKFMDWVYSETDKMSKPDGEINNKMDDKAEDETAKANKDAEEVAKQSGKEPEKITGVKKASENVKEISGKTSAVTKKMLRTVMEPIKKLQGKVLQSAIGQFAGAAAGPIGIVLVVFSAVCMINSLGDNEGPYQMVNVVFVAMKGAAQIMGYASQIQTGESISMTAIQYASRMTMGDNISVTDEEGNIVEGKTKYRSFWDSSVCNVLNQPTCPKDTDKNVQETLKGVGDPQGLRRYAFIDAVYSIINGGGGVLDAACAFLESATDLFSQATNKIFKFVGLDMDEIQEKLINGLDDMLGGKVMQAISWLTDFISGKPLNLAGSLPNDWGNIAMYGGRFTANEQGRATGGKKLSSAQAMKLNLENREFLAWQNSQKPLLARVADPTDYNSSISQVARASHWRTGEQSLGNSLANVFRSLTSMPTILASSAAQISGTSAYAAGADIFSDNIGQFAYDSNEMDELASSDKYNTIENTNTILGKLAGNISMKDASVDSLIKYSKECLGYEIDIKSDTDDSNFGALTSVDNNNGEEWNYIDYNSDSKKDHCRDKNNVESYKQLRVYVMDYENIQNSACYYGDEQDGMANSACNEIGFKQGSSSSSGEISTEGNQPPEAVLNAFQQDVPTKSTPVGAYVVGVNGCTTVSAWWVMRHTTLTYGHGNGGDVVRQLYAANTTAFNNAGISITSSPTKAPSLFSSRAYSMGARAMCGGTKCGHVGLVVSIDPDGTIYTLETYSGITGGTAHIVKHPRSDWEGGTDFIYVGGSLAK